MKHTLWILFTVSFASVSHIGTTQSPLTTTDVGVSVGPSAKLNLDISDQDVVGNDDYTQQAEPVFFNLHWETTGNCIIMTSVTYDGSTPLGIYDSEYDLSDLPISIQFAPKEYIDNANIILDSIQGPYDLVHLPQIYNRGFNQLYSDHGDVIIPGILNSLVDVNNNQDGWMHDSNYTWVRKSGVMVRELMSFTNTLGYRSGDDHNVDEKRSLARSVAIKYIPGELDNDSTYRKRRGSEVYQIGFFYDAKDLFRVPAYDEGKAIVYKLRIDAILFDIPNEGDGSISNDYRPATLIQDLSTDDREILNTLSRIDGTVESDTKFELLYKNESIFRNIIETYKPKN